MYDVIDGDETSKFAAAAYFSAQSAISASTIYDMTTVSAAAFSVEATWSSVSDDCQKIDAGIAPATLAAKKLWLLGTPDWVMPLWRPLKNELLDRYEDWEVWTDWYEARLNGDPAIEEAEIARVIQIAEGEWNAGPPTVNNKILQIIEAYSPTKIEPVQGVSSAIDFGWTTSTGKMRAFPSADYRPQFTSPTDKRDHRPRLDLCRKLAADLIDTINDGRFNTRPDDYRDLLTGYLDNLPKSARQQNILEADHYARCVRSLFAAEASILPLPVGAKLKSFLEAHQSLRVFYPALQRFYDAVRTGRIEDPLPIDSFSNLGNAINESPALFDESVRDTFGGLKEAPLKLPTDAYPEPDTSQPTPPPDPIGDVPTEKARDFERASIVNRLWQVFQNGEKIKRSTEAWHSTYQKFAPHVAPILDWLRKFGDSEPGS